MMRQLWVQLSLVFTIVVITGALTVIFVSDIIQRNSLVNVGYELMFVEDGLIDALERFIDEDRPIENINRPFDRIIADFRRVGLSLDYALVDYNDTVIAGELPTSNNTRSYTFEQDGEVVVTLYYLVSPLDRDTTQNQTQTNQNQAVVPNNQGGQQVQNPNAPQNPVPLDRPQIPQSDFNVGAILAIGSIAGIAGGIFMSRYLTRPLSTLATTARKIGQRDFDTHTPVAGSTEFRDVAVAFNQMAEALKESEYLRNNMIADTAHELRTPLSVMEGNLRAIIDDVYPLSKTEIMRLYEQTRQLTRLVNDLHQLALADAHEMNLHPTETNINELLNDTMDIFAPVAEAEMIDLKANITSPLPSVMIDRGRIRQVIHNLLVNALRHTDENGKITINAYEQAQNLVIAVEDTGTGIPAEHVPRIFERFYRADASRDRASGGTGLGLAIGKAIIEAHNGTITVQSQTTAPSGTRFTITLPINREA